MHVWVIHANLTTLENYISIFPFDHSSRPFMLAIIIADGILINLQNIDCAVDII